jgi:hypothetical protein
MCVQNILEGGGGRVAIPGTYRISIKGMKLKRGEAGVDWPLSHNFSTRAPTAGIFPEVRAPCKGRLAAVYSRCQCHAI